jgi:hypothetical protein
MLIWAEGASTILSRAMMEDTTNNHKLEAGFDIEAEFDLELYKSLRGEVTSYVEKVPGLWLQKFLLVGAVIAFLISRHSDLTNETVPQGSGLLVAAVLSIPVLAALLDAKMLEYGLHARAISRFIASNVPDPSVLGRWESCLWGDKGTSDEVLALVRSRSLMTVVVTAIPTLVLMVLSLLVVGELVHQQTLLTLLTVGTVFFYLTVTWYVWRRLWPKGSPTSQTRTS